MLCWAPILIRSFARRFCEMQVDILVRAGDKDALHSEPANHLSVGSWPTCCEIDVALVAIALGIPALIMGTMLGSKLDW